MGGVSALKGAVLTGERLDAPDLVAVLDHIAHPIFVKDREHRWVLVNEAFAKLLGLPRGELLGRTDHDLFPAAEADFFRAKDVEVFRTGESVVIEQEPLTDASGNVHTLATTKTPLRSASGEVTHLVGIIHDITKLARAEDALRRANEGLELRVAERTRALEAAQGDLVRKERLAVLGQLAGGVAHQIRNPLAAIGNAATLIARHAGDPTDPVFQEAIRILQDEADHANRIVNDLVSYARIRSPSCRAVPLAETLRELVGALGFPVRTLHDGDDAPSTGPVRTPRPTANARISIDLWLSDVPDAFIDELQVHEALRNILRNAVEAMPLGGRMHVSLERAEDTGFVRVVVQDEGAGVPESVREHMFRPLVTTKPAGLGLGLVTAQALVTSQGGRIEWSSKVGEGTRFEVYLPRAIAASRELPARSA